MDGTNYLVPVDVRRERDVDVRYETVTLDDLTPQAARTLAQRRRRRCEQRRIEGRGRREPVRYSGCW